jgi:hypothetical protein
MRVNLIYCAAIVLAMECLRGFRGSNEYPVRITDSGVMRLPIRVYNWEDDFPQAVAEENSEWAYYSDYYV